MYLKTYHRHETYPEKPPPMIGPRDVPSSQIRPFIASALGRCIFSNRSVITTYIIPMIPPPPIPWRTLPASNAAMFCAVLHAIVPIKKRKSAARLTPLRPKMFDAAGKSGRKVADPNV